MSNNYHQVIFTASALLFICVIVIGSALLAMIEADIVLASAPTEQFFTWNIPQEGMVILNPSSDHIAELRLTPVSATATAHLSSPTCQKQDTWVEYIIQPDDTLTSIAIKFGTSSIALANANCLVIDHLIPGKTLYVPDRSVAASQSKPSKQRTSRCGPPTRWVVYIVRPGDTLYRLSLATHVTVAQIQQANCIGNSIVIRAGQRLFLPYLPILLPTATRFPTLKPTATLPVITLEPTWMIPSITPTFIIIPPTQQPSPSPQPTDIPSPEPTVTPVPTLPPQPTSQPTATDPALPTATPEPPPP